MATREGNAKKSRERKTLEDYILRHRNEKGIFSKKRRLSKVVVNGKTMTCAERDNLVVFMYKKNYEMTWIAQSFNVPLMTVQKIIADKVRK